MICKNKNIKTIRIFLIVSFITLLACFIAYTIYIMGFNNIEHNYNSRKDDPNFTFSIKARNGATDTWVKNTELDGKPIKLYGTVYDMTLNNTSKNTISEWKISLHSIEKCYLNNAWCGKVVIHQYKNGKAITDTLDLRNYNVNKIKLNYIMDNPDLLIPLSKGDYIEYLPDSSSKEYPISPGSDERLTKVVFGIIYYTTTPTQLTFSNYSISYKLNKNYMDSWIFGELMILSFIWVLTFTSYISSEISHKNALKRNEHDKHIIKQSIGIFTNFLEAKDEYTKGHSQRVAKYSKLICKKLGFCDDECDSVYYTALMHDCGKFYIPDDILKKPGSLTDEEYEIIKSHTTKGADMLKDFDSIANIRDGVLYHHERYDGKGYPEGLSGNDIPIVARIIGISDAFDAMNSFRCYRLPLSKESIMAELQNGKGTQFDPKLVDIFLSLISEGKIVINN